MTDHAQSGSRGFFSPSLYIRFDDRKQDVINKRVSEDIVVDVGENDKIIGIEILGASRHVALDKLLPVKYEIAKAS